MRIGFLALMLLLAAGLANAAIIETVSEDMPSLESKSTASIVFSVDTSSAGGFENMDTFTWTSYKFEILSGGEFVSGTATSDVFEVVSEVYDGGLLTTLVFSSLLGNDVAPSEVVNFAYDISVDISNPTSFGVDLERTAIPEPTTMTLVVMGAGLLLRRKF